MDIKFEYKIDRIFYIEEGEITLDIDTMLDNSTEIGIIAETLDKLGYLNHYEIEKLKPLKSKKGIIEYVVKLKSKFQNDLENKFILTLKEEVC